MEYATIAIRGNRAQVLSRQEITAGTVGATVAFTFDNSWDAMAKTYVWHGCGVTVDDTAATGIIPAETVARPGGRLLVGVYGTKGHTATPTVWADLGLILPGAQPSGDESADPALPVWAQLRQRLEALEPEAPAQVLQWPFDGPGYTYHDGCRLDGAGQAVADADWAYVALPVEGVLQIHTNLLHAVPGVFLDAEGNILPYAAEVSKDFESTDPENPGPPPGVTLTVPKGAVTALLNIHKLAWHYGDESRLAQYFALYREAMESPLAGKRVLCIGDSITYLDGKHGNGDGSPFVGWQAELRQRGARVDTFAWSGAILGYVAGDATIINDHIRYSVDNGRLDVGEYDAIVIFGGTNDVFCGIGRDYFSANIVHTVNQLRSYNPTARIFMVNILPSYGDEKRPLETIEAYNGTLGATAEGLGVTVLDAYQEMGVNEFTFPHFFYDTVHPNSRGMARLGRLIAGKLEGCLAGKGDVKVEDRDFFTAADTAAIAAAAAHRRLKVYHSPLEFGVSNAADLTAIVTALPAGSKCVFWINDVTFPAVFTELAALVAAPYGTVTVKSFHNVISVKWESYESDLTLLNRYSSVNGVGWSGWKKLTLEEVEA